MKTQESAEMYLETILILSKKMGAVRSIDVSAYMNYSKPSISRAMAKLRNDGFITVDENGYLNFTKSGRLLAEKIYERHTVISDLLINIGVPKDVAIEDACKVEHVISDQTFTAIKTSLNK